MPRISPPAATMPRYASAPQIPRIACERGSESAIADVPAASVHPSKLATIHDPVLRSRERSMNACQLPTMSPPRAIDTGKEYGRFQPTTFETSVNKNGAPSPTMHDHVHRADLCSMLRMTRPCISPTPVPIPAPTRTCDPPIPTASAIRASATMIGIPSNQPNQVVRIHETSNLRSIM